MQRILYTYTDWIWIVNADRTDILNADRTDMDMAADMAADRTDSDGQAGADRKKKSRLKFSLFIDRYRFTR